MTLCTIVPRVVYMGRRETQKIRWAQAIAGDITMKAKGSDQTGPLKRRGLLLGAGAAGAAAVAANTLPVAPVAVATKPAVEPGGYQLTQHVLRYYETAKV